MLVGVVDLLNVSLYVFVSMMLVSLRMEIILMSATPCGLKCSLISSRGHYARSGDFIGWWVFYSNRTLVCYSMLSHISNH